MQEINELLIHHLYNIPFNNVELLLNRGQIISLEDECIENKLLMRKRGGYCFEQNKFFSKKIEAKGHLCQQVLARVIYGQNDADRPKTHLVNIVEVDGEKYLVDAGFGPYNPSVVVPLNGTIVQSEYKTSYRILKSKENGLYRLEYTDEFKKDFSLYQFDLNEYSEADFRLSNYFASTHPESKFVTSLIVSIFSDDGVKFISNLNFSYFNNEERIDRKIDTQSELTELLKSTFKINLTEREGQVLFDIVSGFD